MRRLFVILAYDERGATDVEYGLIAALIAVVIISTMAMLASGHPR
jgi:Flp pilus assembly pilin Flp